MYTGLRTKHTQKITSDHTLKGIQLVDIRISIGNKESILSIKVDGHYLKNDQIQAFTKADGFDSIEDFVWYWLNAKGIKKLVNQVVLAKDLIIYHWTDLRF